MFLILSILCSFANDQYEHYAKWDKPPNVWVCEESGIERDLIFNALEYWRSLGYEYSNISFTDWCTLSIVDNNIVITSSHQQFDLDKKYAITRISYDNDIIRNAFIFMGEEGANIQDVVTHELGHAFGIMHYDKPGDIMHK